jgi:hypothetical protein
MSKGFGPLDFKGSTQEKSHPEIFRFGYRKGSSDKKVPDRSSALSPEQVWLKFFTSS